jgi:hypothetical protein
VYQNRCSGDLHWYGPGAVGVREIVTLRLIVDLQFLIDSIFVPIYFHSDLLKRMHLCFDPRSSVPAVLFATSCVMYHDLQNEEIKAIRLAFWSYVARREKWCLRFAAAITVAMISTKKS